MEVYQSTLQDMENAGLISPTLTARLHNNRGQIYLHQYDQIERIFLVRAEEEFTLALAADQDFVLAWLGRAKARRLDQRYAESRDDCAKTIRLHPNFAPGYACLALDYFYEGAYYNAEAESALKAREYFLEALENAKKAIEADPGYAPAYIYAGGSLCRLDNTEEGEKQIRQAMEIDPEPTAVSTANFWLINFCENHYPPVR
jgi:tetratricopeptide (TPR) repeat protein